MASNGYSPNTVDTINRIKDEVLSQITKAGQIIDSFQKLSDIDGIHVSTTYANDINIKKLKDILTYQHNRVKDLQHTLAFTGAMNAGKSMILNAIIGARILPIRDTAMTTLPTVITHKPKQTQPILCISDVELYNEAMVQIKHKLSAIDKKKAQIVEIPSDLKETLSKLEELKETVKDLQSIDSILNKYCGQSNVYHALFILSEIVRLCNILKLDNPLEKYKSIEQFPRIEIEFFYLNKCSSDNPGVLSLIDSPGFDEVGQTNLHEIVKKVLGDSSATVCVLDSTQFKGWAEKKIKDLVQETQDYARSKLFVLINKFDQKTEGLDENGAIQRVTEQLFPDREIENKTLSVENKTLSVKNKVFPVSGKKAFFANMAIRAGLPLPDKEDWVHIFAELAYGEYFAEQMLKDLSSEEHTKAGNELWDKSKIEQPLKLIVEASLKEAAPECLQIALKRVQQDIIQELKRSIEVFNRVLKKDKHGLEEILTRLSNQLPQIENTKKELYSTKEQMLVNLNREMTTKVNDWRKNVIQEVDKWYSSTTVSEPKGLFFNYKLEEMLTKNKDNIYSSFKENSFPTEEEANNYLSEIFKIIDYLLEKELNKMINLINERVLNSQNELKTKVEETIKPIIEEEKKEFDIKEDIIPKFVKFEIYFSKTKKSVIERKQRDVEFYEIEYKRILWFKRRVSKKSSKKENYYIVAPENIGAAIKDAANENGRKIQQQISEYISDKFQSYLERFFENLSVVFEKLSFATNYSLELKSKSKKVQDKALHRGYLVEKDVTKLMKRNRDTQEGLDESIKFSIPRLSGRES